MLYTIDINDRRFVATKDGEVVADSTSGNDLLWLFNDILACAGDPTARVVPADGIHTTPPADNIREETP